MTAAGWMVMVASLGFVMGLNIFCFRRLLRSPAEVVESVKGPVDSDPL